MKKITLILSLMFLTLTYAQTVVHVDIDATGSNDGTSWANAYNSLHDALNNTNIAGAEIWIAEGTYTPVDASTPFLNKYGVNIYGGFDGTELTKSDRSTDPWLHPVYLSGDINGDDLDELPTLTSLFKSDNANRILQIEPITVSGSTLVHVNERITIDRINFVNAHGGSALYSHPSPVNYTQKEITLINCRFSRNFAATRPAFDVWSYEVGGSSTNPLKTFSLLNSIVDENVSELGYAFEYRGLRDYDAIFIANNLFIANQVEDAGKSGSVGRFISNGAQGVSVRFINNTLSLNREGAGVAASVASCIRLERTSGSVGGAWYNNIYYNNVGTTEFAGSTTTSTAGITVGDTNARDFTPVYDVPNSIGLTDSPFEDITVGDFAPKTAYRQNGTLGGLSYNFNDYPATDCFQNSRTYSSGTIIGLGAIQYANTAMFTGPGDIANLSLPTPAPTIYVAADANGANNGSSWTDAYNSLYDAVNSTSIGSGTKIFVKAGTYKPLTGAFSIANDNIKLIGGFDGTETDESERDMSLVYSTNATIITGDVNDDDIIGDFASNKTDNLDQLLNVNASSVTIDGFILENAHKTNSNPVIYFSVTTNTSNFTLKNSIIRNNYSATGMLMDYRFFNGDIEFINVAIHQNLTNNGVCLFQSSASNTPLNLNFVNVEFTDNQYNSDFGAIWLRETETSNMTTSIVNSTFVNNQNDFSTSTIKHLINISSLGSLENVVSVYNSIFYNNLYNNSLVSDLVFDNSKQVEGIFGDLEVDNCIAPTVNPFNGSTIDGDAFNISIANPNLDANYKPTSTSTAVINQGNNSFYNALFGDVDASGNDRIFDNTIDLGAYEYDAPLSLNSINKLQFSLYPNPTTHNINVKSDERIESLKIYALNGTVLREAKSNTDFMNVSDLPTGIYIMKVKTSSGAAVKKFIKQ